MKIYAVAVLAVEDTGTSITAYSNPVAVKADSEGEAIGVAYKWGEEEFPSPKFQGPKVIAIQVQDEWILERAAEIKKEKKRKS